MTAIERIKSIGIVPLITIEEVEDVPFVGQCLIEGGISCVEVAFRNQLASEGIKEFRNSCPELLVGAGTVINREQAKCAIEAGAQFIISPGLDEEVISFSLDKGIIPVPGVATPTEIQKAIKFGINNLKVFPASLLGGIDYIKAVAAPFKDVLFLPTGGINEKNAETYLREKCVLACGGTWLLPKELIRAREADEIIRIARNSRAIVDKARRIES